VIAWVGAGLSTIDSVPPPPTGPLGGRLFLVIFGTSVLGAIGSLVLVIPSGRRLGNVILLLVAGFIAVVSGVLLLIDGFYTAAGVLSIIAGLTLFSAVAFALQAYRTEPASQES
jgi:hypothetical protein